jgi:hypothetical protein
MKYIILIAMIMLLAGCIGGSGPLTILYTSTLYYEADTWTILQPPTRQWRYSNGFEYRGGRSGGKRLDYLPKYFPEKWYSGQSGDDNNNFFYALYTFDDNVELALWIHISGAFIIERRLYEKSFYHANLWSDRPEDELIRNDYFCERVNYTDIKFFFNIVNVKFDSGSVYLIKNGENLKGVEILDVSVPTMYPYWHSHDKRVSTPEPEICKAGLYDLSSFRTAEIKKPYNKIWDTHINYAARPKQGQWPLPVFRYRFPLTCRDLEDAVLVIDGLYRHDQRLPPLKVRMKYYDFNLVPEYVGPNLP